MSDTEEVADGVNAFNFDELANGLCLKDTYFVIYGIISGFTDKRQFHYLAKLKGPQVGNYLYTTQFLLLG